MSSTNKTTYYNLSQYIGTDKPTYLGDYNSDMSKIDVGIHQVQETATTANQTAGSSDAKATKALKATETNATNIKNLQASVADINASNVTRDASISKAQSDATIANDSATESKQSVANLSSNIRTWETINTGSAGDMLTKINRTLRLLNVNYATGGSGDTSRRVLFTVPNLNIQSDINFFGEVLFDDSGANTFLIGNFTLKTNGDVVYNDKNTLTPYTFYGCRISTIIPY